MNIPLNCRIIRIEGGSLFLSPSDSLPMAHTTLDPEKMRFRPGRVFYWETEIVEYSHETSTVRLRVLDYNPVSVEGFDNQKLKQPVKKIEFEPLEWLKLEPQLTFYQYNNMLFLLEEGQGLASEIRAKTSETESPLPGIVPVGTPSVNEPYRKEVIEIKPGEPSMVVINENFSWYYSEAEFGTGCVRLVKNFKWQREPVLITIENSNIIPEFDLVKSYFHKVFKGQKKFRVQASFELIADNIVRVTAFSPQIALINETLIEGVKRARVLHFISKLPQQVDKSLFTADEFIAQYADNEKDGNALRQSELDILMASLGNKELRNRKQIEYLAGSKQSSQYKLRFTLKPLFGFVFVVEGDTMNHFCWELLNSHATYIWSFSKANNSVESQYLRVERIIAAIRENGREQYKSSYRYQSPEPDMHFSVVTHSHTNSSLVDGFPEWKHRLQERLV